MPLEISTSLRTHTSAAPLKRRRWLHADSLVCCSPHSHECGSVEAVLVVYQLPLALGALRTHTSAAPLKHAL